MEQNLQNLLAQRQQFSAQLVEAESALKEIETAQTVYKIVGNIMVKSKPDVLTQELAQKKELIELRLKSLEKQESQIRDRSSQLKEDVMKHIKEEQ